MTPLTGQCVLFLYGFLTSPWFAVCFKLLLCDWMWNRLFLKYRLPEKVSFFSPGSQSDTHKLVHKAWEAPWPSLSVVTPLFELCQENPETLEQVLHTDVCCVCGKKASCPGLSCQLVWQLCEVYGGGSWCWSSRGIRITLVHFRGGGHQQR